MTAYRLKLVHTVVSILLRTWRQPEGVFVIVAKCSLFCIIGDFYSPFFTGGSVFVLKALSLVSFIWRISSVRLERPNLKRKVTSSNLVFSHIFYCEEIYIESGEKL